ncbi:hypothetical protein [Candidatus Caldatribacterium sp.]|uniref:hypothetical protein n=1 Tax=Candidatus Caldatribacterium sp. TaxID=2282143 RepID=UPI003843439C|nr:hypothetical protein [Candidatus Caldatribacterium sp.]
MRIDDATFIEKGIREVDTFLAQRFTEKGMEFVTCTSFGVDDLLKELVEIEIGKYNAEEELSEDASTCTGYRNFNIMKWG